MILDPNESFGCGRSVVWEVKAIKVAKKAGEACPCISYLTLIIKMTPRKINNQESLKIKISCPHCNADYSKTNIIMTQKFLKFYGRA